MRDALPRAPDGPGAAVTAAVCDPDRRLSYWRRSMAHPIVYGPAGSTHVWSARLALAEKGVTHELVDVPFGTYRDEPHLSRQPFAKVPAFEHDGFALYETQAIMRYVDERFAGTPLQPEDVHEWSRMNQIIGIVDAYAGPSIAGTILFNRDRKSTRLNSSHLVISYAVFCLKKKK